MGDLLITRGNEVTQPVPERVTGHGTDQSGVDRGALPPAARLRSSRGLSASRVLEPAWLGLDRHQVTSPLSADARPPAAPARLVAGLGPAAGSSRPPLPSGPALFFPLPALRSPLGRRWCCWPAAAW